MVLEIDAMRKTVSGSIGRRAATSASPVHSNAGASPRRTTATATPPSPLRRTASAIRRRTSVIASILQLRRTALLEDVAGQRRESVEEMSQSAFGNLVARLGQVELDAGDAWL